MIFKLVASSRHLLWQTPRRLYLSRGKKSPSVNGFSHLDNHHRCSPGGIGNALAREFHSKGLQVIATARTAEAIHDLADLGIVTLGLDVTSEKGIVACKEEVVERTGGGLDYLVNNAGRSECRFLHQDSVLEHERQRTYDP